MLFPSFLAIFLKNAQETSNCNSIVISAPGLQFCRGVGRIHSTEGNDFFSSNSAAVYKMFIKIFDVIKN